MPHAGVINITREVKLSQCQVESCKVAVVGVKVCMSKFERTAKCSPDNLKSCSDLRLNTL